MLLVNLYIDPATTSYLISIISAVVVTLGACIGIFWNKIKRFFKKGKEGKADEKVNKAQEGEVKSVIKAEDLMNDDE